MLRLVYSLAFILAAQACLSSAEAADPPNKECEGALAKQMPVDRFWTIVDSTAIGDEDIQQRALAAALAPLSSDEVLGFDLAFRGQVLRAYTWDLWGVAYIANGGASDDGFEYFRYWLIAQGRKPYETILADPDRLPDFVPADQASVLENELFAQVAENVWRSKSRLSGAAYQSMWTKQAECLPYPDAPAGKKAPNLKERFPKTWRRFGDNPLG